MEEEFKKSIEFLTSNTVDNGKVDFKYLQGKHTIKVTIEVVSDYGRN